MSDKIQMTEEQARWFLWNCVYLHASEKYFLDIVDIECSIREMKSIGVIRRSNLEILIEECEVMYKSYHDNKRNFSQEFFEYIGEVIVKQNNCIQAMKAEIERLKK